MTNIVRAQARSANAGLSVSRYELVPDATSDDKYQADGGSERQRWLFRKPLRTPVRNQPT
jgi:hypothetical protein